MRGRVAYALPGWYALGMEQHLRIQCDSLALDEINAYAKMELSVEQRVADILDMLSYCIGELTEDELHMYLAQGGVELADPLQWMVCSDFVSWYVGEQAIDLSDLKPITMLNLDSRIRHQGLTDTYMQEHMEVLRRGGEYFRTVIMPNLPDIKEL